MPRSRTLGPATSESISAMAMKARGATSGSAVAAESSSKKAASAAGRPPIAMRSSVGFRLSRLESRRARRSHSTSIRDPTSRAAIIDVVAGIRAAGGSIAGACVHA